MIATQFSEQQWNTAIRPAIRVTCNAAGMAKNIAYVLFYSPLEYQGIGVQHIITFLNKGACNSSTGELLRANAELFRVEMGILLLFTKTNYNEKTYAAYMPSGWYKNL